ncbi:MAG: serine/threonine-protein kinase [Verrucomicrobiales bacterium]
MPIAAMWGPPEPPSAAEVGETLPRFEVVRLLGSGALGAVYLARDTRLERLVAIKATADNPENPEFGIRFMREAAAMAKLNHPNLVTIHDYGKEGAIHYLIMDYASGGTLGDLLESKGTLAPERALDLIGQVCDALQYAHAFGVVHRDVKPDNVLLDAEGNAKLSDFGLVKGVAGSDDFSDVAVTRTNIAMGTPRYMAPEQLESPKTVDHRADIYSTGAMLYEMLTGTPPRGRYRPASKAGHAPRCLDAAIHRALMPSPEERYERIAAFKADLQNRFAAKKRRREWLGVAAAVIAVSAVGWWSLGYRDPVVLMPGGEAQPETPPFRSLPLGEFEAEIDRAQWRTVAEYTFDEGPGETSGAEAPMELIGGATLVEGALALAGIGDEGSARIANEAGEGNGLDAIALEATLLVERLAGYGEASPMIVQFSQRWDAGLFVGDQKWRQNTPIFLGGVREPLTPPDLPAPLPRQKWFTLWMQLDAMGYRIWIDGQPILRVEDRDDFAEWVAGDWHLSFGDFEGRVDLTRVWVREQV